MNDEPDTECDECGGELPLEQSRTCACGKTLCPECICEVCD